MVLSTAFLKMPKVFSLLQPDDSATSQSVLTWRRHLLLVQKAGNALSKNSSKAIPALQNLQWCEACLRCSPIKAVRLDIDLGEKTLRSWANACDRTGKRAFIHLPTAIHLPRFRSPRAWRLKRMADWLAAAILLLCLSPLLLLVASLVRMDSRGPIFFRQWRVGDRGRLFQVLKFRTMRANAEQSHHEVMGEQAGLHKLRNDPRVTTVGRWLRKYSLDELSQLLNVLRGEMSLVGPRPLALYDALRLDDFGRKRLNALPGITGAWQVQGRSHQSDLEVVSQLDLHYLYNWSLLRDLQIMVLTIPKVLGGFGAF